MERKNMFVHFSCSVVVVHVILVHECVYFH